MRMSHVLTSRAGIQYSLFMGPVTAPIIAPAAETSPAPAPHNWNLALRILFRFTFCYFVLYTAPEPGRVDLLNSVPGLDKLGKFYVQGWHALVPWVAIHVFHLSGRPTTYFPTGSGDTTLAYIQNLCYVVFALAATLIWSALDRKRRDYRQLNGWLRILIRYTLALTMFSYGFAKVFPLQFRFPGLAKMLEPFGEFSPMGVLWNFMGASAAYTIFSGVVEVTGGLLLLFRRTTTLGAIVTCGAVLNIVMLNFCYDVPVKLYSANLLLMGIYLLAPDLQRLLRVLVLNRPVDAADLGSLPFGRRWMRVAAAGVKVLFVGSVLFFEIKGGWKSYQQLKTAERPPLYGLYEVEKFTRNGTELPPLTTDATRWRKVAVQFPGFVSVRAMDDSVRGYSAEYTKGSNTVTLSQGTKNPQNVFTYTRPDADRVRLEGTLGNDRLSIDLKTIDVSKFLLVSRGFHWINETPFNR